MAVMKDVPNNFASITAILIGRAVQLMIMYVKTFPNIRLTNNFQYQSQFADSDNITW